jgi:hypothetical protein
MNIDTKQAWDVDSFLQRLFSKKNPYEAKPIMTQEEFTELPRGRRVIMCCNGCGNKPVSDQGQLCVECGIMVHEGTFPQAKTKVKKNEVTIE